LSRYRWTHNWRSRLGTTSTTHRRRCFDEGFVGSIGSLFATNDDACATTSAHALFDDLVVVASAQVTLRTLDLIGRDCAHMIADLVDSERLKQRH